MPGANPTSAKIAAVQGPFEGYAPNADAMLRVIRKHRAAADEIERSLGTWTAQAQTLAAELETLTRAVERNSPANVEPGEYRIASA